MSLNHDAIYWTNLVRENSKGVADRDLLEGNVDDLRVSPEMRGDSHKGKDRDQAHCPSPDFSHECRNRMFSRRAAALCDKLNMIMNRRMQPMSQRSGA